MKWVLVGLVALHGLIHLLGCLAAFRLIELRGLAQPIARPLGILWLVAGGAMLVAALLIPISRVWWAVALPAVVLSQVAIVISWSDAKWGTVANLIVLGAALYALASAGPPSFEAVYRAQVRERLEGNVAMPAAADADLARVPEPVRRYIRFAGAQGKPPVHHVRASWRGRIRAGAGEPWMPFSAEQHDFPAEPARFFLMRARRSGLPLDVLHELVGSSARMRVRLLSMIPIVDAGGPQLDRAEAVTLLNDLCLLAPSALADPRVSWERRDERSALVRYTLGANTVGAVLSFDAEGRLVDFVSDDRLRASPDGRSFVPQRWSTPVAEYVDFDGRRAATRGEGRWHAPGGELTYLELELVDLEVNGGPP
jgi:hypothetical protein